MPKENKQESALKVNDEIKAVIRVIEEKKGENIRLIDVRGKSSITDYIILVSALSEPHAKALKNSLDKEISEKGIAVIGNDNASESGWLVLDAFDFMVHIQTEAMRSFYGIEDLWKDGVEIDFLEI